MTPACNRQKDHGLLNTFCKLQRGRALTNQIADFEIFYYFSHTWLLVSQELSNVDLVKSILSNPKAAQNDFALTVNIFIDHQFK